MAGAAKSGDKAGAAKSGDKAGAAKSGDKAGAATSGDKAGAAKSGDGAGAAKAAKKKNEGMASLKVTQVRSAIGTRPKHRGTLRALGLGRIGKTNVLPDRPDTRGMIARVPHLIRVEEVS